MNTRELLLTCKIKLKIESDYALAKALGLPRQRINEYMNGRVKPDSYTLTKIALTLELDPIQVIAEIEAKTEKNEVKRIFWENFLLRASKAVRHVMLAVIFISSLATGLNAGNNPSGFLRRRNFA